MRGRLLRFNFRKCLCYMQMRDCVEQNHAECNDDRDDSEPEEYERALVLPRLRCGNAEDKRETSEYRGQEFDHDGCNYPKSSLRNTF
jgi:hypothetical protein